MKNGFVVLLMSTCSFLGCVTTAGADTPLVFTTLAGSAGTVVNSADGIGSAAQFYSPRGVAVSSTGTIYVADSSNHSIRAVTSAGVTTTLAGTAGTSGTVASSPARFNEPFSLAVDGNGNVFVADTNNNVIRKITAAGVVSTLAGGNGPGSTDGSGTVAKFHEPRGVALDSSGNVYVTDYMNHTVRKISSTGVVTTLAGSAGSFGFVNGVGTVARFKSLQGIAVDSTGNVFVADSGNRSIRKITSAGLVTTLVDGSSGQFGEPRGVAVDASGSVYVADYTANAIYRVTAAGVVSLLAGIVPTAGSNDGTIANALFNSPSGLAVDSANNVYVVEVANNTVRKISGGSVTTLAGLAGRSSSVNGVGTTARFEDPYAVATDSAGNVYVADSTDHSIRKVAADGTVTTLAGQSGSFGSADGFGAAARFNSPQGIAADSLGTVYVADTGNRTVRKITAAGVVSTLAGTAGLAGSTDATGAAARFSSPYGVAADGSGNVYVVDSSDSTVRKITSSGVVTTLAGSPGTNGFVDGTGSAARFAVPFDLAVDTAGNLYVCDHGNHAIRKISPAGVVSTLAGSGVAGNTNGNGRSASFRFPAGISVDGAGNVYVADTDNQVIRKVSPAGDVTTVGGSGVIGSADGLGTAATFYNPKDVAADSLGNIYVTDRGNHTVRKGSVPVSSSASDCLFNWAERTFPQFFAPVGAASVNAAPYYYRYYSGTASYLATSSADNRIWIFGPAWGATPLDVAPVSSYLATAGCAS